MRIKGILFLICLVVISCNSDTNDQCNENLTQTSVSTECQSEFIATLGLAGISCEGCVSNINPDPFSLSFHAEPIDNNDYVTAFDFIDNIFITEPEGCNIIDIFTQDVDMLVPEGSIDNIIIDDLDDLDFTLKLNGEEDEHISCDFCWTGNKPLCEERDDNDCVLMGEIAQSECVAEDMLNSCEFINCTSSLGNAVPFGFQTEDNCIATDCNTLECKRITFEEDDQVIARPGTLTDITNNLTGTMNLDGQSAQFTCDFFAVN